MKGMELNADVTKGRSFQAESWARMCPADRTHFGPRDPAPLLLSVSPRRAAETARLRGDETPANATHGAACCPSHGVSAPAGKESVWSLSPNTRQMTSLQRERVSPALPWLSQP